MDPVTALRQIAYYKDRSRQDSKRVMAYRNAADIVERLDDAERERHGQANSWQSLPGIGPEDSKGHRSGLGRTRTRCPGRIALCCNDLGGGEIRAALRGDLHLHSNWSDGSAPIDEMMATAAGAGPRVLRADRPFAAVDDRQRPVAGAIARTTRRHRRLARQVLADAHSHRHRGRHPRRRQPGPGTRTAERLDVVVASVHSKLSMDSAAMTRRMVRAVRDGHADVLGHCTGRLVAGNRGIRPESKFDAEAVFTACRDHGTAVEINSRPERRDPPTRLLNLALDIGCVFSIDTDAHAPGQLDFLGYGAQRALDAGVPVDRIVNTWPAEKLLEWTASVQ